MSFQRGKGPDARLKLAEACSALVRRRSDSRASVEFEDALQDACLRAIELETPQTVQEPVRYVRRMARNLFVDYCRRQARAALLFTHSENAAQTADDRPGPERTLAGKETLAGIMAAIDLLPPRCREAFLLHRFENCTYPTIARRMGISISMVEKHIAEAMMRLARALKEGECAP